MKLLVIMVELQTEAISDNVGLDCSYLRQSLDCRLKPIEIMLDEDRSTCNNNIGLTMKAICDKVGLKTEVPCVDVA